MSKERSFEIKGIKTNRVGKRILIGKSLGRRIC